MNEPPNGDMNLVEPKLENWTQDYASVSITKLTDRSLRASNDVQFDVFMCNQSTMNTITCMLQLEVNDIVAHAWWCSGGNRKMSIYSVWPIIINAQRFRWLTNAWKLTENIIIVIKWAMPNTHTQTRTAHTNIHAYTQTARFRVAKLTHTGLRYILKGFRIFLVLGVDFYINEPLHILCEQTTVKSIPQNEIYSFDEQMNIEHCVNAEYELKTVNMS